MQPLAEKVSELVRTKNLFPGTYKIVVAVSGGIDSMVLLNVLAQPGLLLRDRLIIAHFNHQLRGEQSDADAAFVEQAASALGLPFELGCADTHVFANESGEGLEAAARELRHSFFTRLAKRLGATTVALAHQADDQVETFFLRLARGAGPRGLSGMAILSLSPVDPDITLVRPMIELWRSEVEAFAVDAGIEFREDESNADTRFFRNKIRHQLLPTLVGQLGASVPRQVAKAMKLAADDADCIDLLAERWLGQADGEFETLPVAVQRQVVQRQLFALAVEPSFDLVEALRIRLGQAIEVALGKRLQRNESGIVDWAPSAVAPVFSIARREFELLCQAGEVEFGGLNFSWERTSGDLSKWQAFGHAENHEVFDANALGQAITLRHWQPGDRFQPIGQFGTAKLQDLFVNQKVPREERHQRIIGEAADGRLFWVEGLRIAEPFKVTEATQEIFILRFG